LAAPLPSRARVRRQVAYCLGDEFAILRAHGLVFVWNGGKVQVI
jgi:hypothetical protein